MNSNIKAKCKQKTQIYTTFDTISKNQDKEIELC